jgi:hypothetical protein
MLVGGFAWAVILGLVVELAGRGDPVTERYYDVMANLNSFLHRRKIGKGLAQRSRIYFLHNTKQTMHAENAASVLALMPAKLAKQCIEKSYSFLKVGDSFITLIASHSLRHHTHCTITLIAHHTHYILCLSTQDGSQTFLSSCSKGFKLQVALRLKVTFLHLGEHVAASNGSTNCIFALQSGLLALSEPAHMRGIVIICNTSKNSVWGEDVFLHNPTLRRQMHAVTMSVAEVCVQCSMCSEACCALNMLLFHCSAVQHAQCNMLLFLAF